MRTKALIAVASLLACVVAVAVAVASNTGPSSARPAAPRPGAGSGGAAPLATPADELRGIAVPTTAPPPTPAELPPAAVPLTSHWHFLADPGDVGLRDDWPHGGAQHLAWSRVALPHDFNPQVVGHDDLGTIGWYKGYFTAPPAAAGRAWQIHFEEVRSTADVWLNGVHIGRNTDAFGPFDVPASTLRPGTRNTLLVRVDNRRNPSSWPEDWWNWGGIVRPVTLVPVGRVEFSGIGVMPKLGCRLRCANLLVEGTIRNLDRRTWSPSVTVGVRSPENRLSSFTHPVAPVAPGRSMRISFLVPIVGHPDLWAPGHPALYHLQILTRTGRRVEQVDTVRSGLREVAVRHGVLLLNGRRLWLHGASIHEDIAGRGAALTDRDIATIVDELKAVHANITRAHYLLSQRLLDALDAAGILLWSQAPVDHADAALQSAAGRAEALAYLRATIIGDRSHPSVVIDSVGNELTPTPDASPGTRAYLQAAIPLARVLDPAAAVALDTYCYPGFPAQSVNRQVDVIGISHYFGWYRGLPGHTITEFGQLVPFLRESHARYPGQALVVAEFGAEGLYDGAASTKGTYAFQADYLQRTYDALTGLPFMNGAIYWTLREFAVMPGWVGGARLPDGTAPSGLHHKGLIAYDGTPKPAFSVAQRLFATPPPFISTG